MNDSRPTIALPHITAGFVAILVGYASSAVIVFQAAQAAGASPEQTSSWMWALGLGMGIPGIGLSIWARQPILIAWSTPGAALLVTSLPGIAMGDAIGSFLFCSVLLTICGVTGLFDRIVNAIPPALAAAMLAGLLLRFARDMFPAFESESLLVGVMAVVYVIGKWRGSVYTVPLVLLTGMVLTTALGLWQGGVEDVNLTLTTPVFVTPTFDLSVLLGVGLPLFVVTMASQNLPGIATLRAHGYDAPASPMITVTGLTGLVLGCFGGFALNLAAITAALCMGEDVDKDPNKRWMAGVWTGVFLIVAGLFGGAVAGLFALFPREMVAALAGMALLGTIGASLKTAVANDQDREAAVIAFVLSASGGTFLTIAAPFWGLLAGYVVWWLMRHKNR